MKQSKLSETQTINILKEEDARITVEEQSLKNGFNKNTFHK
jgi:hypothetical protein